jgi:hypothetical protein
MIVVATANVIFLIALLLIVGLNARAAEDFGVPRIRLYGLSSVIAERGRFGLLLQPLLASGAKTCRGYFFSVLEFLRLRMKSVKKICGRKRAGVAGSALKGDGGERREVLRAIS